MSPTDGLCTEVAAPLPIGNVGPSVDYHTDYNSGDSHSSLELFRESPAKYAAIRVFRKTDAVAFF